MIRLRMWLIRLLAGDGITVIVNARLRRRGIDIDNTPHGIVCGNVLVS